MRAAPSPVDFPPTQASHADECDEEHHRSHFETRVKSYHGRSLDGFQASADVHRLSGVSQFRARSRLNPPRPMRLIINQLATLITTNRRASALDRAHDVGSARFAESAYK